MVEWAHRFDCPVLVHELDREWVQRPDDAIEFWSGDTRELWDDLTLLRLGGHFAGGQVLHWPAGDALLSGDIVQVLPGRRWVSFMYSYPMLIPLPAREVERIAAALEPWEFERIYGAWWGRVMSGGRRRTSCGVLLARYVRSDRLTSRHSRSAFATRNASESSGSAGRPPRSRQTASAIVAPNDAVISTHVSVDAQPEARGGRRGRARRTACRGCRGSPCCSRRAPGTRTRGRSKTPAWWWTIVFVGPRQTEYASTHGMISATTTTHDASSKKSRKSQPANVAAPSFANEAGPSQPRSEKTTASTTHTTTREPAPAPVAQRQAEPDRREHRGDDEQPR